MKRRNFVSYSLLFLTGCTTSKLVEAQRSKNSVQETAIQTENELATINMALIPWQVSVEQEEKLKPLTDYLTQKLNRPFKFQIAPNYNTAVDLLVEGKVELAYLASSTYIEARLRDPNVEPLAAPINKHTGRPWYTAVIIANSAQGIKTIADLKGKRFAFVNKLSTSGYIVPMGHFLDNGIDPEREFAEVIFAGSHDKAKAMLLEGKVDAIAEDKQSYTEQQKEGSLEPEKYKIIWESAPIPNLPIVASSKLSPELKNTLKKALIDAPDGLVDPTGAVGAGYTAVEDSDYDIIRKLQKRINTK